MREIVGFDTTLFDEKIEKLLRKKLLWEVIPSNFYKTWVPPNDELEKLKEKTFYFINSCSTPFGQIENFTILDIAPHSLFLIDLEELIRLLATWSTVPSKSSINIFSALRKNEWTHKDIFQYLSNLAYTLLQDSSVQHLPTLFKVVESIVLLVSIPGSKERSLHSVLPLVFSLLKKGLSLLDLEDFQQLPPTEYHHLIFSNLEESLCFFVKLIVEQPTIFSFSNSNPPFQLDLESSFTSTEEFMNLLGLCSSRDVFGIAWGYPLRELSYFFQYYILAVADCRDFALFFSVSMKWVYFNLMGHEKSNFPETRRSTIRATQFMLGCYELLSFNKSFKPLLRLFKTTLTKFDGSGEMRSLLAANLAKLLGSLDYSEAQDVFEHLLKDSIQFLNVASRSLAVELVSEWCLKAVPTTKHFKLELATHYYKDEDLLALMLTAVEMVTSRFLDSSPTPRNRALVAYLALFGYFKKLERNRPDLSISFPLISYLQEQILSKKFKDTILRCTRDSNAQTRLHSTHIIRELLVHQTETIKDFALLVLSERSLDPNWAVRKASFEAMAELLPNRMELVWSFWADHALPSIFDSKQEITQYILDITSQIFNQPLFLQVLNHPFKPLSFKGLKTVFCMLSKKVALPTASLADQTFHVTPSLLVNIGHRIGVWQLISAYSIHFSFQGENFDYLVAACDKLWNFLCGRLYDLSASDRALGQSLLVVIFNWVPITHNTSFFAPMSKMLLNYELPISWIPLVLQILQKWDDGFKDYATTLGTFSYAKLSCLTQSKPIESFQLVAQALFILGELHQIFPGLDQDPNTVFELLLQGMSRGHTKSVPHVYFLPHSLRALTLVSLGKLALVEETLSRKMGSLIATELNMDGLIEEHGPSIGFDDIFCFPTESGLESDFNYPGHVVRNALLVFPDLCQRYSSLLEPYFPLVANCLRHPHPMIRREAYLVLTRLLRADFIKWSGSLALKFIVATVTESDPEVLKFAYYCLVNILLIKSPKLLLEKLPDLIYYVNGHPQSKATTTESYLFTFPGDHKIRRCYRHRCYKFILEHLTLEQKLQATYIICQKIIVPAANGKIDITDNFGTLVVSDALRILGSKEIQITVSKPDNDDIVSAVSLLNVLEMQIPALLALKLELERLSSPLYEIMIMCLGQLVVNYHIDEDILIDVMGIDQVKDLRYHLSKKHIQKISSAYFKPMSEAGLVSETNISSKDEYLAPKQKALQPNLSTAEVPKDPETFLTSTPLPQLRPPIMDSSDKPLRRNPRRAARWSPGIVLDGVFDDIGSPINEELGNISLVLNENPNFLDRYGYSDFSPSPFHINEGNVPGTPLSSRTWANYPDNEIEELTPETLDPEGLNKFITRK